MGMNWVSTGRPTLSEYKSGCAGMHLPLVCRRVRAQPLHNAREHERHLSRIPRQIRPVASSSASISCDGCAEACFDGRKPRTMAVDSWPVVRSGIHRDIRVLSVDRGSDPDRQSRAPQGDARRASMPLAVAALGRYGNTDMDSLAGARSRME